MKDDGDADAGPSDRDDRDRRGRRAGVVGGRTGQAQ
jgi:hypothetical protein